METTTTTNNGGSKGVLSFIFGLASLIIAVIAALPPVLVLVAVFGTVEVLPAVGLILGVLAIVFSVLAKKAGNLGGLRKAGFVLGIIGIVFAVISFAEIIACNVAVNTAQQGIEEALRFEDLEDYDLGDLDLDDLNLEDLNLEDLDWDELQQNLGDLEKLFNE